MKKYLFMLAYLAFTLGAIGPLWAAGDLKVPEANIIAPGPDVQEDMRAFSGKWKGRWSSWACPPNHGLDAILAVEEITPNKIKCQYSWGNDVGWGQGSGCVTVKSPNFKRIEGKLYLTWKTRSGVPFYFWAEGGKLKGKKGPLANNPYEITMERF
ncbi:MAG: hypothetical protein C4567_17850 [Deltaproteobacteria bacterium]|nr:MAG: hypothetical protein C4567_17850 [Deltaproteobacteria bacterium]